MAFSVVFKRYFPPRTQCFVIRIHSRLGTMPLKCPRHSTTSHGSHVSQGLTFINMRSISFYDAYFLLAVIVEEDESSRLGMAD